MAARPMHFEIQASNPPALMDFYSALFGWSFNKWEGGDYWMIHTGPDDQPGINGGLLPRRGPAPAEMAAVNAFVITVIVDNLDVLLAKVGSIGGGAQVAVPKMPVPGIGWLAYVKDPDGNIFGMMQPDARAG
ncbi:MAG: glyoxalase [Massilia sp.]|nr:glyoxalase [Massilia sp.]